MSRTAYLDIIISILVGLIPTTEVFFILIANCELRIANCFVTAKKIAPTFKIPKGEHYVRVESGKGELGIYIIGGDNFFPWRWKIRAADFNNLQALPQLLKGMKVADIVTILGSIDMTIGSVDR